MAEEPVTPKPAPEAPAPEKAASAETNKEKFLRQTDEQLAKGEDEKSSLLEKLANLAPKATADVTPAGPKTDILYMKGTTDVGYDITKPTPKENLAAFIPVPPVPARKVDFKRIVTPLGPEVDKVLQESQNTIRDTIQDVYETLGSRIGTISSSLKVIDKNVRVVDTRQKTFQTETQKILDQLQQNVEKQKSAQINTDQKFMKIGIPEKKSDATAAGGLGFGLGGISALTPLLPLIPYVGSAIAIAILLGKEVDSMKAEGGFIPYIWKQLKDHLGLGSGVKGEAQPGQNYYPWASAPVDNAWYPFTKSPYNAPGPQSGIGRLRAWQAAHPGQMPPREMLRDATIMAGPSYSKGSFDWMLPKSWQHGPATAPQQFGRIGPGQLPQPEGGWVAPRAGQYMPPASLSQPPAGWVQGSQGRPWVGSPQTMQARAWLGGPRGTAPAAMTGGFGPGGIGGMGQAVQQASYSGIPPAPMRRPAGVPLSPRAALSIPQLSSGTRAAFGQMVGGFRGGGVPPPSSSQAPGGPRPSVYQQPFVPTPPGAIAEYLKAQIPEDDAYARSTAGIDAMRQELLKQSQTTMFGAGAPGVPEAPGIWGMMGNIAGSLSGGALALGAQIGQMLGGGFTGGSMAGSGASGSYTTGAAGGAAGGQVDPDKIIADVASGKISPTAGVVQVALTQKGLNEVKDRKALTDFMGGKIDPSQTAWCAAFVNASLEKAGIKGTGSLAANSFRKWGDPVSRPQDIKAGDVLVREHHVFIATGDAFQKDGKWYVPHVGGNEGSPAQFVRIGDRNIAGFEARRARKEDIYVPPGSRVAEVDSGKAVPAAIFQPGGGGFGGGGATGTAVFGPGGNQVARVVSAGKGFTQVEYADGRVEMRKGDFAWRNNNPGNIEFGPFAKRFGAIPGGGRFAMFPSIEAGNEARKAWWFEKHGDETIAGATAIYAPPNENDTGSYAARLAKAVGADPNTKLSDLTPAQQEQFLHAQLGIEGNKPGQIEVVKEGTGVATPAGTQVASPSATPIATPPDAPTRGGADASVRIGAAPLPLSGGAADRGEDISLGKMNPQLRAALAASKADIDKAVAEGKLPESAKQFSVGSGFRPPDDPSIQRQWAEWKAKQGPKRPMADPSKSQHGKGEAADLAGLPKDAASVAVLQGIFSKHGVYFPVGKEGLADTGMPHAQLAPGGPREPATQVAEAPATPTPVVTPSLLNRVGIVTAAGAAEAPPSKPPPITPELEKQKAAGTGAYDPKLKTPPMPGGEPTRIGESGRSVVADKSITPELTHISPHTGKVTAGASDATSTPVKVPEVKVTGTTGSQAGASGTPPPKMHVTGTTGAHAGASGTAPKKKDPGDRKSEQGSPKQSASQPKQNTKARTEDQPSGPGNRGSEGGGGGASPDRCHFCDI